MEIQPLSTARGPCEVGSSPLRLRCGRRKRVRRPRKCLQNNPSSPTGRCTIRRAHHLPPTAVLVGPSTPNGCGPLRAANPRLVHRRLAAWVTPRSEKRARPRCWTAQKVAPIEVGVETTRLVAKPARIPAMADSALYKWDILPGHGRIAAKNRLGATGSGRLPQPRLERLCHRCLHWSGRPRGDS